MRRDLLGLTFDEFSAWTRGLAGHEARYHRELYRQVVRDGRFAPRELKLWRDVPADALARLAGAAEEIQVPGISVESRVREASRGPDDGPSAGNAASDTVKVLMRQSDGREVESVLIPMKGGSRHTVCVSSQVGCRMGCSFCHTARMGLVRSLAAHEIVAQVVAVAAATGIRARNVVFMGMGEPLDNPEAVAQAVRVMTDRSGLALAHRHITVSTVGRGDGLARWNELGLEQVNLAVSLTAADDELRSELMPVNRVTPLAELKRALVRLQMPGDRRILISYVLIPGVNDRAADISRLAAWLDGLKTLVNLIPYNPIPSRDWRAPTAAEVQSFQHQLATAGIAARVRMTKGDTVMAACGQLGDPTRRARAVTN